MENNKVFTGALTREDLQRIKKEFEEYSKKVIEGRGKCGGCEHPQGDYICKACIDKQYPGVK